MGEETILHIGTLPRSKNTLRFKRKCWVAPRRGEHLLTRSLCQLRTKPSSFYVVCLPLTHSITRWKWALVVPCSRSFGPCENFSRFLCFRYFGYIHIYMNYETKQGQLIKKLFWFISSVRSSRSHPDLLVIHPLFQITPVLNTGLSLSEPLQLYKGYNAI